MPRTAGTTDEPGHPVPVHGKARHDRVLPDDARRYLAALHHALGGPVVCLPLDNGIQLWCHRDGLVSGLAVTRRVLAMSLDELGQFEIALGVGDLASPIFFSRSSNATGFDIYVAHRLSTSDGFGTPVAVTELCRARRRGKQAIRWPRL